MRAQTITPLSPSVARHLPTVIQPPTPNTSGPCATSTPISGSGTPHVLPLHQSVIPIPPPILPIPPPIVTLSPAVLPLPPCVSTPPTSVILLPLSVLLPPLPVHPFFRLPSPCFHSSTRGSSSSDSATATTARSVFSLPFHSLSPRPLLPFLPLHPPLPSPAPHISRPTLLTV